MGRYLAIRKPDYYDSDSDSSIYDDDRYIEVSDDTLAVYEMVLCFFIIIMCEIERLEDEKNKLFNILGFNLCYIEDRLRDDYRSRDGFMIFQNTLYSHISS